MPLSIINQDITTMDVDAIINSTNHRLIGYSGVDKLIHDIGGKEFEEECDKLRYACVPGEAIYTNAYNLKCRYIIHTVSLGWSDGIEGEAAVLRSCYKSSLELAEKLGCRSVAFPLISAGALGFPISEAIDNAVKTITEYLRLYSDMDVYLVIFGAAAERIAQPLFDDLDGYIKENLIPAVASEKETPDLDDMIYEQEESFPEKIRRLMKAKGIKKPSQIYLRAGMSKSSYSKLMKESIKRPSMETAVGLAFAFELSYDEAVKFFASAGIALSKSSKYDIIVSYFLKSGNYSIPDFNQTILYYGYTKCIGAEE